MGMPRQVLQTKRPELGLVATDLCWLTLPLSVATEQELDLRRK